MVMAMTIVKKTSDGISVSLYMMVMMMNMMILMMMVMMVNDQ